jgi:hypothetical protein
MAVAFTVCICGLLVTAALGVLLLYCLIQKVSWAVQYMDMLMLTRFHESR